MADADENPDVLKNMKKDKWNTTERQQNMQEELRTVSFTVAINGDQIPFRLPCRWEAIKTIFESRRKRRYGRGRPAGDLTAQAKRVAWRQILRWVEAQLALTETRMAKLHEVFMPYLIVDKGQTIFERLESQNWKFQLEHRK